MSCILHRAGVLGRAGVPGRAGDHGHANSGPASLVRHVDFFGEPEIDEQQSPNPAHDPAQASDKLDRGVLLVAGVVVLGAIMSILDITVVSVALKTFQTEFDATAAQVAWTMTGYTLALASVIPLTGWAADRFGTKRLYLLAVGLFTAGSVLCATANTLEMLTFFRVLQGLGGGMLMPLGMTILTRAAGPERIGRVMAVLGVPMLLGPIFGPILGGLLIDSLSWHWIFLINLPIGIGAFVYAFVRTREGRRAPLGVLRLRRHAAPLARPRGVPVRRLLDPRGRHHQRHEGAHLDRRRARC